MHYTEEPLSQFAQSSVRDSSEVYAQKVSAYAEEDEHNEAEEKVSRPMYLLLTT